MADVNSNTAVVGKLQADDTNTGGTDIANDQSSMQVLDKSCNMASDIPSQGVAANNCDFSDVCKELGDYNLTKSDVGMMPDVRNAFSQPTLASKELPYGGKSSGLEGSPVGITSKKGNILDSSLPSGRITNELGDATSSTLQENDNISVSCSYSCCSNCVHTTNAMAHKMISIYLRSNECCSIDDVHDIITSCSLNILTSFRKYFISESISNLEENCRKNETELDDGHNDGFKRMTCHCKVLEKTELLPVECDCHTRMEGDATTSTNAGCGSLFGSKLTYFFRDGVLLPHVPNEGSELHCNFEKMCVCSIAMILHTINQTFER